MTKISTNLHVSRVPNVNSSLPQEKEFLDLQKVCSQLTGFPDHLHPYNNLVIETINEWLAKTYTEGNLTKTIDFINKFSFYTRHQKNLGPFKPDSLNNWKEMEFPTEGLKDPEQAQFHDLLNKIKNSLVIAYQKEERKQKQQPPPQSNHPYWLLGGGVLVWLPLFYCMAKSLSFDPRGRNSLNPQQEEQNNSLP